MNLTQQRPRTLSIDQAAEVLYQARRNRVPIAPIAGSLALADLGAAYAIAAINTARRQAEGARVTGMKVGLTARAVQQQLGVDEPDFGVLFDDMEVLSGQRIDMARLMQPKAEAEVAFIVGRDLRSERPSMGEFLACLAYVVPALEIVDSAIAQWQISLADTVADNASCGLYVLGDNPTPIGQVSLAELGMQMHKNGVEVATGCGAACMGHPLRAAYWLARTMARHGQHLSAGQIILSGALGPMVPVVQGDHISAVLGALGQVSCQFE